MRPLRCDCGRPAVDVWSDYLSEWLLCETCLADLERDLAYEFPSSQEPPIQITPSTPLKPKPAPSLSQPSRSLDEIRALLSPREFEVAQLVYLSIRKIADRLGVSIGTVKSLIQSVYQKLKIHSRQELLYLLASNGGVPEPEAPPPPLIFTLIIQGGAGRLSEVVQRLEDLT